MEALVIVLSLFAAYVIYVILTGNKPKPKPKTKTLADYGIHINQSPAPAATQINPGTPCFAWPELMEYDFEVVGESHYQEAIEKIAKQQAEKYTNNPDAKIVPLTAYLIPDDHNEYDDKAVRVDINGMQVGYLSREDARSFRRRLGAKKLTGQVTTCCALITGGHIKDGNQAHYGVVLDMKPFE